MTSRERVNAVLNGKKPDRIPFNFWMDRNLMAELDKKLGEEFRINHYGADVYESFFGFDFNCGLSAAHESDHKTSWQLKPALESMENIHKLKFPDIKEGDRSFFANLINDRKRFKDVALFAMCVTPFEAFLGLRMMENAMMDIYDYPDEVKYYLNETGRRICALVKQLKDYDVDVLYLAGDLCSSKGLMFSPDVIREFAFEPVREVIKEAHKQGLKVFYHSDGNLADILPIYLEYGFDGINPLQPHVNDSAEFKRKYSGKLMLYGGIDNCFAIPDSDVRGVKKHILSQYEILGKNGGLIFSSHDIPDYVKLENVDMMVKTIKEIKV